MSALEYWLGEIVNRADSTKSQYVRFFERFCDFTGKTPDELIEQRKNDLQSDDIKTQMKTESLLKRFIAHLEDEEFSTSSQQNAYAAVRSFFEMHYMPLRMRRGDYPSGESYGHRAASKKEVQRILEDASLNVRTLILFLKDCGLRVGDVARLKIGALQPGLDNGYEFIPIKIITKKNRVQARTWIGPEAVASIHEYLDYRRRGTRRIPPENITDKSPVFRTRTNDVKPLSRSGMSSTINNAVKKAGLEGQLSAHSLRKFFQTRMESAGVSPDWIDQMVGRKLPGVRTAYSQPTTQDLFHSYQEAYNALHVFDVPATQAELQRHETEIKELRSIIERRDVLIEGLENELHSQRKFLDLRAVEISRLREERVETKEAIDELKQKWAELEKYLEKQ